MINRYIKMIKYLFIFIIIDAVALTELFFIEIIYRYNMFYNIVNNRDFIFINVFLICIMFSFADQTTFKYRVLFLNKRLNKTSKLNVKTLFANVRRR